VLYKFICFLYFYLSYFVIFMFVFIVNTSIYFSYCVVAKYLALIISLLCYRSPQPFKAFNNLICAEVPLRTYLLTHACQGLTTLRPRPDFLKAKPFPMHFITEPSDCYRTKYQNIMTVCKV